MDGFPEARSALFQNTAGKLAFAVFRARGQMTHGLDEIIPGEVVLPEDADVERARTRLIDALERFDGHDAPLRPHFAYGRLDKSNYALAHAMHVDDHLEIVRAG